MAKTKKVFDKDLMYKKIMPTNIKKQTLQEQIDDIENEEIYANDRNGSIFQNKEINIIKDQRSEIILYNVMEKLVMDKLDITLKKMNCCRCDRCKKDIIAMALNKLKPMYVVATKEEINKKMNEFDKLGLEVTTAVLKAVLRVRKEPRH